MVIPVVFVGSVDSKDTFFSVPLHPRPQKYLNVSVDNYHHIVGMHKGYSSATPIFTKLKKVPFSLSREEKLESGIYADDSYLQRDTYEIVTIMKLLGSIGYTIYAGKSSLIQSQKTTSSDFSYTLLTWLWYKLISKEIKLKSCLIWFWKPVVLLLDS